jgi:hypothetical protein
MALTFSFNSVRDLMAKLEREAKALNEEAVTGDRFFNFAITGYSMIDWVKKDPSVPRRPSKPAPFRRFTRIKRSKYAEISQLPGSISP